MFGEILKQLRKMRGVTQEELAKAIGVERSNIGKYEGKQQSIPSPDVLCELADYFAVSVDYLLGRSTQKSDAGDELHGEEKELFDLVRMMNTDGKLEMIRYSHFILMDSRYRQEKYVEKAN